MNQLEKFVGGWWLTPTTYIQLAGAGSIPCILITSQGYAQELGRVHTMSDHQEVSENKSMLLERCSVVQISHKYSKYINIYYTVSLRAQEKKRKRGQIKSHKSKHIYC